MVPPGAAVGLDRGAGYVRRAPQSWPMMDGAVAPRAVERTRSRASVPVSYATVGRTAVGA